MYSNLHRVPTQKTFLLTQREDIKHIDKSKWQPGHSKSNSGWWGQCCCCSQPGSGWLSSGSWGWNKLSQRVFCFLFWGYKIVSAALRYLTVLCRAFIQSLLASSLTQLSGVHVLRQVLRASFSCFIHFFQVLVFVQALCDKRIPSKAHQLCAVIWAWGCLQLSFTFLRGSLCSKF